MEKVSIEKEMSRLIDLAIQKGYVTLVPIVKDSNSFQLLSLEMQCIFIWLRVKHKKTIPFYSGLEAIERLIKELKDEEKNTGTISVPVSDNQ